MKNDHIKANPTRLAYGEALVEGKVVKHEGELEVVSKMAALKSQGFSYWKVADVLNLMKVPTKTGRGKWHARSVQEVLNRYG